jgi:Uri superfamily endonuclease
MISVANLDLLPATSGAYALMIRLGRRLRAWPNSGPILAPGLYLYAGSANGPGGIRARVRRHARHRKPRHWHVDRLTCNAPVIAVAALPQGNECDLVAVINAKSGTTVPAPDFGSSDCGNCSAHLLALPPGTQADDLSQYLPSAIWWWRERPGEL